MFEDENQITVEEANKALSEIESRYSPTPPAPSRDAFEENIVVLSKEFDSIGLETIDTTKPLSKVFKQIVSSARELVQIHRRTLSQMRDANISVQSKNENRNYLRKVIDSCNSKINLYEDKTGMLHNKISVLEDKILEHQRREIELRNEMEQIKRYSSTKNNELARHIRRLTEENSRLRESLGTEFKAHSKDEVLLKVLSKYKKNEDIYKDSIRKLQENNKLLLEEIVEAKSQKKS